MTRSQRTHPSHRSLLVVTCMVLAVIASGLAVAPTLASQHNHSVTVEVTNADGDPISDATVRVGSAGGATDGDGIAELTVSEGTHDIVVVAEGYEEHRDRLTVDGDTTVTVALERPYNLDELNRTIEDLENRLNEVEAERDQLREERDQLQQERDDLQDELDETDQQIADLEETIAELEEDESLPGFGFVVAIAAVIGAIGILARRR